MDATLSYRTIPDDDGDGSRWQLPCDAVVILEGFAATHATAIVRLLKSSRSYKPPPVLARLSWPLHLTTRGRRAVMNDPRALPPRRFLETMSYLEEIGQRR
jgi:hypothetical protein